MKDVFLFQKEADTAWSRKRKAGYWAWNFGWVILAGIGIGLVSMMLAVGPYSLGLTKTYFSRPRFFFFNIAPVVALILLLYGLTRSARRSYLLTALVVLGLSAANYYKLTFRDDPLMFADLLLIREAGDMAGKYRLFLDGRLAVALACAVGGDVFLLLFVRGRPGRGKARWGLTLLGAAGAAGIMPLMLSDTVYNTHGAYYAYLPNQWSSTQQYISRGFVYPFLHSISSAIETPPEGYDEQAAEELLADYEAAHIPDGQKVNVVAVMLESFNDFTKFGTPELAQDVYATWHQLEEEGYSGNLVTNIFAGGTIDSERAFLTGYSTLRDIRGRTNSYPWYFRSEGYRVEGMHPCYEWFYNRLNVNENLGFEDYKFVENYFGEYTGGGVGLDDLFFQELIKAYDAGADGEKPYFNFSVTYQGHGPYDTTQCVWGERGEFVVDDGSRSDEEQNILDNYFGSIANTNQNLKLLTDFLREDDRPVVLVLFGDHNPWLGDGNSVYHALGIDLDVSSETGFYNYYATRYIIWANDAAKEALGKEIQGEGPTISPCFLMGEVFAQCGWVGPSYLQAIRTVMEQVPVMNTPTGLYVEDGSVTSSLSERGQALVDAYEQIQYYERHTFRYGGQVP